VTPVTELVAESEYFIEHELQKYIIKMILTKFFCLYSKIEIFCYKFAVLYLYLILAIIISDSVDLQDFCKLF